MPALIRATHPSAFRSGEWAVVTGTAALPFPGGGRPCYLVTFPGDVTDFWIADEGTEPEDCRYGYEFLMT